MKAFLSFLFCSFNWTEKLVTHKQYLENCSQSEAGLSPPNKIRGEKLWFCPALSLIQRWALPVQSVFRLVHSDNFGLKGQSWESMTKREKKIGYRGIKIKNFRSCPWICFKSAVYLGFSFVFCFLKSVTIVLDW